MDNKQITQEEAQSRLEFQYDMAAMESESYQERLEEQAMVESHIGTICESVFVQNHWQSKVTSLGELVATSLLGVNTQSVSWCYRSFKWHDGFTSTMLANIEFSHHNVSVSYLPGVKGHKEVISISYIEAESNKICHFDEIELDEMVMAVQRMQAVFKTIAAMKNEGWLS